MRKMKNCEKYMICERKGVVFPQNSIKTNKRKYIRNVCKP